MPSAQQLGRYHLLDRIAYGGMAEIFRAKTFDPQGNVHLVAIKRLLGHLVTDDEFLAMLVDEAKITALLSHQNIARVYEFGHAGDEYFLAMEYIDGKDVRALLERARAHQEPIPPEHAAWIAMEAATALHAAHVQRDPQGVALRIVHRDVSPSNILCSYRGDVKLCDFGIAKATLTRVQTKTGVIKGKVKYMSPEQAMGRKLDHRSDIFSLGTVLYEMMTLQAPFQAPTEVELIFAVRDARKKAATSVNRDCPPELSQIIDKAMTRSRTARYQSGEQLALDLRLFLDQHKPGYRRSHFSRFMRKQFSGEIERELRQLENYTIEHADDSRVGINLLAEALGPDAPFSRFTPAWKGKPRFLDAGSQISAVGAPPDEAPAPVPYKAPKPSPFNNMETMVKPSPSFHNAETRLFALHDPRFPLPSRTVEREHGAHESLKPKGGTVSDKIILDDADLIAIDEPSEDEMSFHDQATRILDLPSLPTRAVAPQRATHSPAPAPPPRAESTAVVRLRASQRERLQGRPSDKSSEPEHRDELDEPTSDLGDADLEEI